ncbi:hypothetical protein CYK88_15525 [Clostridium perfringens]|nr:hypothetical protein CYK69_14400 [Clostridium perfringens]PWX53980.1 hypothetical protein CYK88_15525 [Clostridium perfringens]
MKHFDHDYYILLKEQMKEKTLVEFQDEKRRLSIEILVKIFINILILSPFSWIIYSFVNILKSLNELSFGYYRMYVLFFLTVFVSIGITMLLCGLHDLNFSLKEFRYLNEFIKKGRMSKRK